MVLERAEITIKPGLMDEFLTVLAEQAIPLTQTFTGIISFTALRGEEDADNVMFLAEWQSLEAHLESRPRTGAWQVSRDRAALYRQPRSPPCISHQCQAA